MSFTFLRAKVYLMMELNLRNIIHMHNNVLWDWQYFIGYSSIHVECGEYSKKDRQSHITLLWI